MKLSKILVCTILSVSSISAQNEFDAMRYHNFDQMGDARATGMAGAFGALGGNLSRISVNPAGIGVLRKHDFSLTWNVDYNKATSHYNGNTTVADQLQNNIGHIGLAFKNENSGSWNSTGWAIGYNRLANYNLATSTEGISNRSFLDIHTNSLNQNGGTPAGELPNKDPFGSGLSYETYLVNPTAQDSLIYDHVLSNSSDIRQQVNYFMDGGQGEYFFTYGGNYNNKLFVGAMVSITDINYKYRRRFSEELATPDTLSDLTSYEILDNVRAEGYGYQLKLGFIYTPTGWMRFGFSAHTGRNLKITETYTTDVNASFDNGDTYEARSPDGKYSYIVHTPFRTITSLAIVVGDKGVISFDHEFSDYSRINLSAIDDNFVVENQQIDENFQMTHNFAIGTEWKIAKPFTVRAGFKQFGNPLAKDFPTNYGSQTVSAGVGINILENTYLDLAYSINNQSSATTDLVPAFGSFAKTGFNKHNILMSLVFRY